MKHGSRARRWVGFGGGLLLSVLVVRSVLASRDVGPDDADRSSAGRVLPQDGGDERSPPPEPGRIAGNGVVEPAARETNVAAEAAGLVETVHVVEGQRVEAGHALATLAHGVESARLDAASADVHAAEVELARLTRGLRHEEVEALEADVQAAASKSELSASEAVRAGRLFDGNAVNLAERDAARSRADVDRATETSLRAKLRAATRGRPEDVAAAQARLEGARARREEARHLVERSTVRAPVAGEVLAVKIRPGEYYAPGQPEAEPLLLLGDTSRLRVRMDVDERDVARVRVGSVAVVRSNSLPGQQLTGRVDEVGRRLGRKNARTDDPVQRLDTKILEVMITLDAPGGLLPGQRVTAYVQGQ